MNRLYAYSLSFQRIVYKEHRQYDHAAAQCHFHRKTQKHSCDNAKCQKKSRLSLFKHRRKICHSEHTHTTYSYLTCKKTYYHLQKKFFPDILHYTLLFTPAGKFIKESIYNQIGIFCQNSTSKKELFYYEVKS